ncbi:hypothetical protein FBZ93_111249 [Bradyrhizobium macuxiense]|uniref:Uncharacterized protein n=1 Tax=Bradyrhizobium macuxiense TaxID=1755647 RepID=A0A560LIW5_9BRAD|nr:hypothetical protein FBZ93_111249 [Bradyrhizobium macuxiense]
MPMIIPMTSSSTASTVSIKTIIGTGGTLGLR